MGGSGCRRNRLAAAAAERQVTSKGGATCTVQDDGSVLVSGTYAGYRHLYSACGSTNLKRITAVRLEALPHESLPDGGPGRRPMMAALSLSRMEVFEEPITPAENVKFVRVELPTGTII